MQFLEEALKVTYLNGSLDNIRIMNSFVFPPIWNSDRYQCSSTVNLAIVDDWKKWWEEA